jgi:O-antigen/teichoic acid export membrane protein
MKLFTQRIWIGRSRSKKEFLVLLILGFFLSITQASAYIGPSTASMIWQLVLAMFLAAGYVVHLYWWRIKNLFKKKPDTSKE